MPLVMRVLRQNPIILVMLMLAVVFGLMNPEFLSGRNIANILRQSSMLGLVALGMSFVILTRGIDLSVGSTLALSSVLVTGLSSTLPGIIGIHVALAAGLLVGVANGLLITKFKFQPIIVTLCTMAIVRGLAMTYSNSRPIFGTLPDSYYVLSEGTIWGIPVPTILFVVICLLAGLFLNRTVLGRQIYQVGGNEEAARLAGINVDRVKILTYALSGLLAALAGLVLVARMRSGDAVRTGIGWELDAIAAAAIGGMSLAGGVGTVIGTFCGTLVIGMLANAFNLLGINPYWQRIVIGIVLGLAVATYSGTHLRVAFMERFRSLTGRTRTAPSATLVKEEAK